jgi:hypothetical protein
LEASKATPRIIKSIAPPGGKPTRTFIAFDGNLSSAAKAPPAQIEVATETVDFKKRRREDRVF